MVQDRIIDEKFQSEVLYEMPQHFDIMYRNTNCSRYYSSLCTVQFIVCLLLHTVAAD